MSLAGVLATSLIVGLVVQGASCAPAEQRASIPIDRDHFLLVMLLNRLDFAPKAKGLDEARYGEVSGYGEEGGPATSRDKRIGSLSIVNSVDVLRQRVLLELARRQAMEDQRQISENRRLLDSMGKRSGHEYHRDGAADDGKLMEEQQVPRDDRSRQLERLLVQ
ncbi:diuretic hormone 44 [Copidosoma floridanum]|uniref:diuretic hormone 44 n=1 Tax=Copidosoma floridanum TaxID=29053 RepID=UPI0006C9795B|nr:diuretic hormone 44 [Copidosoma floridanum]